MTVGSGLRNPVFFILVDGGEVARLRQEIANHGLSAFIVPTDDDHQSEYVGEADERRKYISGFSGSAGTAVVLMEEQALWTDGRYFLQADEQLDCNWLLMKAYMPGWPACYFRPRWLGDARQIGGDFDVFCPLHEGRRENRNIGGAFILGSHGKALSPRGRRERWVAVSAALLTSHEGFGRRLSEPLCFLRREAGCLVLVAVCLDLDVMTINILSRVSASRSKPGMALLAMPFDALAICWSTVLTRKTHTFTTRNPNILTNPSRKPLSSPRSHNDLAWNLRMFLHNKLHSFNLSADLAQEKPWMKSSFSHTDLPRLRRGHVAAQFWSVYVPCESQYLNTVQLLMEQIDVIKRMIAASPEETTLVTSPAGIEAEFHNGRVASLMGVEGGHSLASSMGVMRALYDLGVRYITLTHKCHTPWAECSETGGPAANSRGLTPYGKEMIREMNRLGMMVDLSHSSTNTVRDALETSLAPVIFFALGRRALCDIERNVPDDASNRGLVMVSFYNDFLTCGKKATIRNVIEHINHIRSMAGVDHVGLGAGYDGINRTAAGLEDVSKYPELFAELLRDETWSLQDLKKLAGVNLLRVFREVEQ
ncbi:putative dipeptidase 1-like, partial [Penaeus vannamei]